MRLRLLLCALPLAACVRSRGAATERIASEQHVRLALFQDSYWGGGFDRPLFIAFDDGTVIYPRSRDHGVPADYLAYHGSPSSVDSILAVFGADSIRHLQSRYDFAPNVTDQHSFFLFSPKNGAARLITVRAGLLDSVRLRPGVPPDFVRIYDSILAFNPPGAKPWQPDSVEVLIWPYEYAPDGPPLEWPRTWPSLTDSRWKRRSDDLVGEVRTVRLPFSDVPQLDSLLKLRREKQAIGLGGRKWAMGYRWVFPQEAEWAFIRAWLES